MNATTKKAGSKRAVFAIEDAIADTRRRITGSAKDLQKKAQAALEHGPRLVTEKDGRLFAMDALERLQNVNADEASAYPHFSEALSIEDTVPFRTGPQWDGLFFDLMLLKLGTTDAVKGFASIATSVLAGDIGRNMDYLRELERAGKFKPFGTAGTEYKAPKVKAPAKARG